MRLYSSPS
jgi:DNA-binding transcriptional regulator LsrR (DeoR family)